MSFNTQGQESEEIPVTPITQEFTYEIVTSNSAQQRGLGGRESIPTEYGMLFVFEKPSRTGFWMKDMLTSIDIIWLSENGTILGIEDSISPDTYLTKQIFYPPEAVRFVLETRAGESRRKGWEVGTKIELPKPYGLR